jgi:hypothetical protein
MITCRFLPPNQRAQHELAGLAGCRLTNGWTQLSRNQSARLLVDWMREDSFQLNGHA